MSYRATIDFTAINGLPCQIGVVDYVSVKGSYSYNAPSSDDYYGYEEIDFELLDRNGRRAKWIEARMSKADRDRAEQAVIDHYRSSDEC